MTPTVTKCLQLPVLAFTTLLQGGPSCTSLTAGSLRLRVDRPHSECSWTVASPLSSPLWLSPRPCAPHAGEEQGLGAGSWGGSGSPMTSIFLA